MFNWRQKLHSFIQHPFVKDTAILQAGNFFNIGLGILTSVLTARLLQPDKYGLYTLISSFAGLAALFMNFGADRAATTLVAEAYAKKDKIEIKNVLAYFLKINGVIAPLIGIAMVIIAPFVTLRLYHSSYLGEMSRLAICTFIFIGTFWSLLTIALQVSRRMMNYVLLDNLNTLLRSALCVGLILLGWGVWGILMGQLLAAAIMAIISLFFYRFLAHRSEYFPKIRTLITSLGQVSIKKYFKFGFLIAIDQNLSGLYQYLPMVFLGLYVPVADIGYFRVALNYVSLPLVLLGPISQLLSVQLPVTKISNPASLKKNLIRVTVLSLIITVVCMAIFLLLAPFLINLFFGKSYEPSLKLIYYLSAFAAIQSIGVGMGAMFRTLNKMDVIIKANAVIIVLGAPIVFWLIKSYGLMGVVVSAFSWPLISDIFGLIYLLNFLNKPKKSH